MLTRETAEQLLLGHNLLLDDDVAQRPAAHLLLAQSLDALRVSHYV